jgi:hypothetical protein
MLTNNSLKKTKKKISKHTFETKFFEIFQNLQKKKIKTLVNVSFKKITQKF